MWCVQFVKWPKKKGVRFFKTEAEARAAYKALWKEEDVLEQSVTDIGDVETCVLCGSPDYDLKRDHLRTVWVCDQEGRLGRGFFRPRLTENELRMMTHGEHPVCANRRMCRRRMEERRGKL